MYKDTAEVDERGETVIYLVTEPVKPLDEALRALRFDGTQRCVNNRSKPCYACVLNTRIPTGLIT